MKGLTQKQRDILNFVEDFIDREGMAPTVYEIAEHFGTKTSTIFAHLRALQKKGYLSRSSKARSISLLRRSRKKPRHPAGLRSIPVYDDQEDNCSFYNGAQYKLFCDSSLFGKNLHSNSRSFFGVRVHGTAMKNFGILDGDIAIVRKYDGPFKCGDIVLMDTKNGLSALRSCAGVSEEHMELVDSRGNAEIRPIKDIPLRGIVVGLQRAF